MPAGGARTSASGPPLGLDWGALLEATFRRVPEAQAISDGETTLSYSALDRVSSRRRDELLDAGVRPGDRVAIVQRNHLGFLVDLAACARLRAPFVAVGAKLSPAEIAYILDDAGVAAVISDAGTAASVEAALALTDVEPAVLPSRATEPSPGSGRGAELEISSHPSDLLYLGYTSGTTGRPKGAVVTHQNRANACLLWAVEFGLGPGDRHLVSGPLYHTAPLTFALTHLVLGASIVVPPSFDPEEAWRTFRSDGVTNSFMAPILVQRLLDAGSTPIDSGSLTALVVGGAPFPPRLKDAATRALGPRLHEFYGGTEVGVVTHLVPAGDPHGAGSVGRPIIGAEVEVRSDTGAPLPSGEVGRIHARTPTMCAGYWGRDETAATAAWRFIGDHGFLDEHGFLHISGRDAEIIISGGVNIYAREVERVLETYPTVGAAAAVGIDDPEWGQAVHAFLECTGTCDLDELKSFVEQRIARFKVPRVVHVVDHLPRSPAGKILKRELTTDTNRERGTSWR